MTLFAILLMFLRHSDYTAASATTCILHLSLQLVLHISLWLWSTIWIIPYLRTSFPHTLQHQLLVFDKCALYAFLCLFATFACFAVSIESYIGNSSQSFQWLDQSHNQLPSMMSCIPTVQCYCSHKLQRSLKHINEGASNIATTSDPTLYSFHPCASVILSKIAKPGVKSFIFLSRQLFLWMELAIAGFVLFDLTPFL